MRPLRARTILRPAAARNRFWPCGDADWTINPYRGCEIGCVYCHARYTHEFIELRDWRDFERRIFYKADAASILARDLARLASSGRSGSVAIGTVTDSYQPAEARYELTRGLLRALLAEGPEGLEVRIATKSDLIIRDIGLLTALARRGPVRVSVTITTLDRDLARALEPGAPSPVRRLWTLRELRRAGLGAGVLLMPIIPGVNDDERSMLALAHEAKAAGAQFLADGPLVLRPAAVEPFFRFLRRHRPQLENAYRQAVESEEGVPARYGEKVRRRAAKARRAAGLLPWPLPAKAPRFPAGARPARQLEIPLFSQQSRNVSEVRSRPGAGNGAAGGEPPMKR